MEKYRNTKHPLSQSDIIEMSVEKDDLKSLLFESLKHPLSRPFAAAEDELCRALQEAQKEPTLGGQVFRLLDELSISVFGRTPFSPIISHEDNKTGSVHVHDKEVHPLVIALAKRCFIDQELEFFEYLVNQKGVPANHWRSFFRHLNTWHKDFVEGAFDRWIATCKPEEEYIFEGLLRHINKEPLSNSPLSIKFWFKPVIWFDQKDEIAREEQIKKSKNLFGGLALKWISKLSERGELDRAYNFYRWLSFAYDRFDAINDDQKKQIEGIIFSRVVPSPLDIDESIADEERLDLLINASLFYTWQSKNGDIFRPSEENIAMVEAALGNTIRQCVEPTVKVSHDMLEKFIRAANPNSIDYIGPFLEAEELAKLSVMLLAMMRSRMKYELDHFDPLDYKWALFISVFIAKEPELALKQLMLTFRQCPERACDDDLEFRPVFNKWELKESEKVALDPLEGFSPSRCVACFIHMIIARFGNCNDEAYHEMALGMADFMRSRICIRKGIKLPKDLSSYEDEQCVESNPVWRKAYVQGLGELGYDLKGSVHRALNYVKKYDPDPVVRDEAKHSLKLIKRGVTKNLDDEKSLKAAFFWLRWAQYEALGGTVNKGRAMIKRHSDLSSYGYLDVLYHGFLYR